MSGCHKVAGSPFETPIRWVNGLVEPNPVVSKCCLRPRRRLPGCRPAGWLVRGWRGGAPRGRVPWLCRRLLYHPGFRWLGWIQEWVCGALCGRVARWEGISDG